MRFKRSSVAVLVLAASVLSMVPQTPAWAAPLTQCIGPGGSPATTNVKLITDLTCAGTDGIVVGANGITIDLNGHSITGNRTAGNHGIDNNAGFDDVTVKGGTLTKFFNGVLGTNAADGMHVKKVLASGNDGTGISIFGDSARVRSSRASGNAGSGIFIGGDSARVRSSRASGNAGNGIVITSGDSARVSSSQASGNSSRGIFIIGDSARVRSSRASGNASVGIVIDGDAPRIGRTSGRPASDKNRADANGFSGGASNGSGLGILAIDFTTDPVGRNVANGNDDPSQCSPSSLC